jgi:hypothetical protein
MPIEEMLSLDMLSVDILSVDMLSIVHAEYIVVIVMMSGIIPSIVTMSVDILYIVTA